MCGVRENRDGTLYTLVYGCPIAAAVDPIEKKPLFHFLPGSLQLLARHGGLQFRLQVLPERRHQPDAAGPGRIAGAHVARNEVVAGALAAGCRSVSYTYTEPTIFYEYARDCARLAAEAGLKNVFVTNGYMTRQMLADIDGLLHAANVDLKSFSDEFYRSLVGARLNPVLDSIRRLVRRWGCGSR